MGNNSLLKIYIVQRYILRAGVVSTLISGDVTHIKFHLNNPELECHVLDESEACI